MLTITFQTSAFSQRYKGVVTRVIDGDTLVARLDLGLDVSLQAYIRLDGVDTFEIRTKDLAEKKKGLKEKIYLESLVAGVRQLEFDISGRGKFGRWIAVIYKGDQNINKEILNYHNKLR